MANASTDIRNALIKEAKKLLGSQLVHETKRQKLAGKIVEVEAYHQADPASHTFRGLTPSNQAMFGLPHHAYIYFTYGAHYCFNVTAGPVGEGAGILVRALEPLEGIAQMAKNRFGITKTTEITDSILRNLTNGPGKLTQALAIDKALYGHDLSRPPLYLQPGPSVKSPQIVSAPRIGISQAVEEILRFYIKGNVFVSRK